jgi:hypothetical protein
MKSYEDSGKFFLDKNYLDETFEILDQSKIDQIRDEIIRLSNDYIQGRVIISMFSKIS